MTEPVPNATQEDMKAFFKWLGHKPDEWTELRAIEYSLNHKGEVARIFVNNEADFLSFCKKWNGKRHVYAGLNPRKRKSGKNKDVARVVGIPFDIDPENTKVASTDEEKRRAKENAEKFVAWLQSQGYLAPYLDDSGNGFHVIQRVNIPVDDSGLLENQLRNYFKELIFSLKTQFLILLEF